MNIRDRIKSLRRVKASELRPNPRNWRTHPEAQRNALKGILAEIGYADALLVREMKGGALEIIDGHLRADLDPDQKVPVLVTDLTKAEADKLLAVLDPLAAMAEANQQALGELLHDIETDNDGLQAMLDDLAEQNGIDAFEAGSAEDAPEAQVDRAAELQEQWGTELGQLWEIPGKAGTHRLLCGDSTVAEDVGRVMGGQRAACVLADPPYGCGKAEWDGVFVTAWYPIVEPWGVPIGTITGSVGLKDSIPLVGAEFVDVIAGRNTNGMTRGPIGFGNWLACVVAVAKPTQGQNAFEFSVNGDMPSHPSPKPLSFVAWLVERLSQCGDIVFDPFLGSGTTMVAAEQLGRICYGIEISAAYCAVILQRMTDLGLEPRKAEQ